MSTVVPGVHQSGAPSSSLVWRAGEDQVRDGLSFERETVYHFELLERRRFAEQ